MLVNGNVSDLGKPIEFRFKNEDTGSEYVANGQTLIFVADGIMGWVEDPYPFFSFTTAVVGQSATGYHLEQNLPNPANRTTVIGFTIPQTGHVWLNLYDLTGNVVSQLVNEVMTAGHHNVQVDLQRVPEGIYYYELKTGDFSGVKKLVKQ
jgi:trimeric autotransporter adhesin